MPKLEPPPGVDASTAIEPLAAATAFGFRADLRVVDDPADDWIPVAALAGPIGGIERHRRIADAAGPGAPPRLPLVWEIEALAWHVGVLAGGSVVGAAALPSPGPASTWARIGEHGLTEGLAIAADTPCVEATSARARALIISLAGALVPSDNPRLARVLWWHVGDRVADAVIWSSQAFGARDRAATTAEGLLAPGVPYSVPFGAVGSGPDRVRRTCCLSRRTAAGETCDGCPHRRRR